ncbi:MAG: TonB-dependent receptor [Bryobacterales bacterium]|nr:TonB-dependent receptor [Bryobacterales bacterium]
MKRIVLGSLAILATAGALLGQALSGTVVGTVTDQAGAIVPGAKVTLVNDGTKFTRSVVTNQSGQYVAYAFPPGMITISVEQPGFQRLVRGGVQLTAADTLTVDLLLQVGNVQQTIEVTGAAPLLQTQTASVSTLVDNQRILEIPLLGRSFTQLLQLMPGAIPSSPGMQAGGTYGMRSNSGISISGSQGGNNSYLIDGIFNRGLWLNNLVIVPPIDSIQEVRVMASNFSAEYGAAAGAVTVAQSKSGSNQFHGSLYEFLRNDKFDANGFFNNRASARKPAFRRNEFGGTVGGPIRHDKTFFFTDYQGIRLRQPTTTVSTIPTLARQAMVRTGDFTGLGTQIYDPYTMVAGPNNTQSRAPFSGNQIPVSILDPIAGKLMTLLPVPMSDAATRNYTYNPANTQRTDQFDVRLDQNLGAADRLFFKYSYDNSFGHSAGTLPAPPNAGIPIGPYFAGNTTNTTYKNWSAAANFTKVIGTSIVNETRLAAVRWNQTIWPTGAEFATASALGIPGINISTNSGGLPAFSVSGYAGMGISGTYPEYSRTISYQYENILTVVRGSHTFKFGGLYLRHIFNGYSCFPARGSFNFNGQYTRQVGSSTSATALSDFALGASNDTTRGFLAGTFGARFWDAAGFVDDTWRVTNRLTVNAGLRWETQAPPYEVHDRYANFNIETGLIMIANRDGNSRTLRKLDRNNFGPRLGITYMLTSDRKTVLRTGFGMSYVEAFDGGQQLYKNLPFYIFQSFPTDQNAAPVIRIRQGLPAPVAPDINDKLAVSGGNPVANQVDLRQAKAMSWSFGIQREIVTNLLLETAYVGTKTINVLSEVNINQPFPGPGAVAPRRPYYAKNPGVGDIKYNSNFASAKYHSLQSRLEKRLSYGLSASVAYTFSKSLTNGHPIQGGGITQNARCFNCEWGNTPEHRKHVVVLNHVWQLPFGPGRKFQPAGVLAPIVGNWDVSGFWSLMTGQYFTPTLATGVSNAQREISERPNRLRDGNLPNDQRTIDRWFDTGAFVTQPQYTFGNAGRNILEAPGYFNLDLSIRRDFRLTEKWLAAFRWEMFNAMNHVNFNAPNASIGSSSAGQISSARAARIMQLALKLSF